MTHWPFKRSTPTCTPTYVPTCKHASPWVHCWRCTSSVHYCGWWCLSKCINTNDTGKVCTKSMVSSTTMLISGSFWPQEVISRNPWSGGSDKTAVVERSHNSSVFVASLFCKSSSHLHSAVDSTADNTHYKRFTAVIQLSETITLPRLQGVNGSHTSKRRD